MNDKNTGGPAFPVAMNPGDSWCGAGGPNGMTLRDYFATKVTMPPAFALAWAEQLAGRKHPEVPSNHAEWVQFWADAEAAYRYLHADAMLKAREL